MNHWTITLDMRYSQEKRSFKQALVNFHLSQFFSLLRDPRFIYSLLDLLLLSSYFSSNLFPRYPSYIFSACLLRSYPNYNCKNIKKSFIHYPFFSRTVFPNCTLFIIYVHIYIYFNKKTFFCMRKQKYIHVCHNALLRLCHIMTCILKMIYLS